MLLFLNSKVNSKVRILCTECTEKMELQYAEFKYENDISFIYMNSIIRPMSISLSASDMSSL